MMMMMMIRRAGENTMCLDHVTFPDLPVDRNRFTLCYYGADGSTRVKQYRDTAAEAEAMLSWFRRLEPTAFIVEPWGPDDDGHVDSFGHMQESCGLYR